MQQKNATLSKRKIYLVYSPHIIGWEVRNGKLDSASCLLAQTSTRGHKYCRVWKPCAAQHNSFPSFFLLDNGLRELENIARTKRNELSRLLRKHRRRTQTTAGGKKGWPHPYSSLTSPVERIYSTINFRRSRQGTMRERSYIEK